jgi:hypothetical protein
VVGTPAGLRAAAASSVATGSAHVEATITFDGASLGVDRDLELTMAGDTDFADRRAAMATDMGAFFDQLGQDVPAGVRAAFAEPMRTIQDGSVIYVCGGFVAFLGADAECIRMDLADQLGPGAQDLMTGTGNGLDPSTLLETLGGADAVEEVGHEAVGDVAATHLRGTMTMAEAIDRAPAERRDAIADAIDRAGISGAALDTPMDFDVWIGDDDGLVHRIRQAVDLSAADGALPAMTMDIVFSRFGQDVDIEVPADAVDARDIPGFGGN